MPTFWAVVFTFRSYEYFIRWQTRRWQTLWIKRVLFPFAFGVDGVAHIQAAKHWLNWSGGASGQWFGKFRPLSAFREPSAGNWCVEWIFLRIWIDECVQGKKPVSESVLQIIRLEATAHTSPYGIIARNRFVPNEMNWNIYNIHVCKT